MNEPRPWWLAELGLFCAALAVALLPWIAGAGGAAVLATVLGVLFCWHALQPDVGLRR